MPDHLFIRADAGAQIGTGHVMRMLALAQAYQDRSGRATIACASCPEGIAGRIRQEKISLEPMAGCEPGSTNDLQHTNDSAKSLGATWVALDGYHFNLGYQRALREAGFRVLAVDDYGHCDTWAADAVLNQNIFAPELNYRSEVEGCRFLLGTRFALLRREFREEAERRAGGSERESAPFCQTSGRNALPRVLADRHVGPTPFVPIRRLLITLGGVDADNVTSRLMAALDLVRESRLEIKALVGAGNPHLEEIRRRAAASFHSVEVLQNVTDMPALYRWAEGVISAGGSTCWEWMFYQLPAAVVCLAENQRPVIAGLVKHRLALDLGWHSGLKPDAAVTELRGWLNRSGGLIPEPSRDFAVDGRGACRVAAVVDGSGLWIRNAIPGDCRLYFEWANDPGVRANAIHTEPILWKPHEEWFERKRKSPTTRLYVACNLENIPVGQVRLDKTPEGAWEAHISVAKEWRSRGFGLRMLDLVLRVFWRICREPVCARVKLQNTPSANLFRTLGFRRIQDCEKGIIRFTLSP